MRNRRGEIATLLTLGLVLVGTAVTIATSLIANNQKNIASGARAGTTYKCCKVYEKSSACNNGKRIVNIGNAYQSPCSSNNAVDCSSVGGPLTSGGSLCVASTPSVSPALGSGVSGQAGSGTMPAGCVSPTYNRGVPTCNRIGNVSYTLRGGFCCPSSVSGSSTGAVSATANAGTSTNECTKNANYTCKPYHSGESVNSICQPGVPVNLSCGNTTTTCCTSAGNIPVTNTSSAAQTGTTNSGASGYGNGGKYGPGSVGFDWTCANKNPELPFKCCVFSKSGSGCGAGTAKVTFWGCAGQPCENNSGSFPVFACSKYPGASNNGQCTSTTATSDGTVPETDAAGNNNVGGTGNGSTGSTNQQQTQTGTAYPQNAGRTPGMACCFKQGNKVRVYAHASAREINGMETPCTKASYGNAYNADDWFECPDTTAETVSASDYENSFTPATPSCSDAIYGRCPANSKKGSTVSFKYYNDANCTGDMCFGLTSTQCTGTTMEKIIDFQCNAGSAAETPCAAKKCKDVDSRYSVKNYYVNNGIFYADAASCQNNVTSKAVDLATHCAQEIGFQGNADNQCKQATGNPLAYCNNLLPFGTNTLLTRNLPCKAGYEHASNGARCGIPSTVCCVPQAAAQSCARKNCQSLNSKYAAKAYYEKDGVQYDGGNITYCSNNDSSKIIADLTMYCSQAFGIQASADNSCKNQTGDPQAYCNNLLPFGTNTLLTRNLPCKSGFEHASNGARCGIPSTVCCVAKTQEVQQETTFECSNISYDESGNIICEP